MSKESRCAATIGNVRCELPNRHNSPHKNTEDGTITWEPRYVGDLRNDLQDARREVEYLSGGNS